MKSGRRRLAMALSATVVLGAAAGGLAWSRPVEERRLGQRVARALGDRTGLAVSVDRARIEPARVVLSGIRIDAGAELPVALKIGSIEIAVEGMATRELATSTLAARWEPGVALTAMVVPVATAVAPATLDALRERLRTVMGWPGALRVRLMDGELRRGGVTYAFAVRGEKLRDGALDLTIDVSEGRAATPPGVTLRARVSAPAGRAANAPLDVALEGRVDPAVLARVWPGALPRPAALATRSTLTLGPGGDVDAVGRLTVGRPEAPALVDFTSRYEGRTGRLAIARYAVDWKPGIAIEGTASLEADGRLAATATGAIDAGRLDGRISYAPRGAVQGTLTVAPLQVEALAARLGVTPISAKARSLTLRVSGTMGGRMALEARARELTVGALSALDAALDATSSTPRGGDGTPPRLEAATLSLARQGQALAVVKGASRGAALWPLSIDGSVADLARLAPLLPWPASLQGTARLTGDLTHGDALRFAGMMEAEMPRAEATTGTTMALDAMRARIPVLWTAGSGSPAAGQGTPEPGSLFVERGTAFGFELDRVIGTGRLVDGRLRFPDLAWTHYGGHGGGWLELALVGDPVPLRSRVAGERVDLAEVVRALGSNVARVTGRVGYQITLLYAETEGVVVLGRVTSEEHGGEIGIDVLEQLLQSPAVQVESSGVLRQTLQNLRRFDYESLAGEFRWSNGAGFIDLTLRGKKRLGIFPGPVEAINIKNMPLSVLTRALRRP